MPTYYYKPRGESLDGRVFKVDVNTDKLDSSQSYDYGINRSLNRGEVTTQYARSLLKNHFPDNKQIFDPRRIIGRFTSEAWDIFYLSLHELEILSVKEVKSKGKPVKVKPDNHDPNYTYERIAKAFVVRQRQSNPREKQIAESLSELV